MRTKKKKAPAGVRVPTRAAGKGLPTTDSRSDCSTVLRGKQSVFELLSIGSNQGVTLRQLAALTGLDERVVRLRIQQERKSGKLILSNNRDGYFLPEHPEDVQRFARSMSRRAAEIAGIARAAENALADMVWQEQIVGW